MWAYGYDSFKWSGVYVHMISPPVHSTPVVQYLATHDFTLPEERRKVP